MKSIENQYTNEQERQFNNYMRQFAGTYTVRRGTDHVLEIPCRYGDIEPYSLTELCCYQAFFSARKASSFMARLPSYCTISQRGGVEVVFRFPNGRLDEIALLVGARRKTRYTPEALAIKRAAMQRINTFKKTSIANRNNDQKTRDNVMGDVPAWPDRKAA